MGELEQNSSENPREFSSVHRQESAFETLTPDCVCQDVNSHSLSDSGVILSSPARVFDFLATSRGAGNRWDRASASETAQED